MKLSRQLPQAMTTASAPVASICRTLSSKAFRRSGCGAVDRKRSGSSAAAPVHLCSRLRFAAVDAERLPRRARLLEDAAVPTDLASVVAGHPRRSVGPPSNPGDVCRADQSNLGIFASTALIQVNLIQSCTRCGGGRCRFGKVPARPGAPGAESHGGACPRRNARRHC